MKIQDIIFFAALALFIYKSNPKWSAGAGIASFVLSIPLFSLWIFFTAERLVWYGAGFIFLSVLQYLRKNN